MARAAARSGPSTNTSNEDADSLRKSFSSRDCGEKIPGGQGGGIQRKDAKAQRPQRFFNHGWTRINTDVFAARERRERKRLLPLLLERGEGRGEESKFLR